MTEEGPKMLSVDSIHEEYEYIAKQRCECGGTYQVNKQTLLESVPNGKHFDSLRARCVKCGAVRSFAFDVSKLFQRYDRPDFDVSELFRRYERMLAKRKQNDAAEEEADKRASITLFPGQDEQTVFHQTAHALEQKFSVER